MTDFAALEAACRKKVSAKARAAIFEEVHAMRARGSSGVLASALEFLLEREDQIDAALNVGGRAAAAAAATNLVFVSDPRCADV